MNQSHLLSRFFIITILVTVGSLGLASYSSKKAYEADPQLLAKIQEKYNVHITSSGLLVNNSPMNSELTENQWELTAPRKKIVIKTHSGGVSIKNTSNAKIRIFASGQIDPALRGSMLEVTESSNELVISEPSNTVNDLVLRMEIPNSFNQDIQVISTSGDLSAENLNLNSADFTTVSGELTLNRLMATSIDLKTVSGEINITDSSFKSITGKTVSGDVEIDTNENSEAKLRSVSGDIKLTLPTNGVFNFRLKTTSGEISNKHSLNKNQNQTAGPNIDISTTSGDIEIE